MTLTFDHNLQYLQAGSKVTRPDEPSCFGGVEGGRSLLHLTLTFVTFRNSFGKYVTSFAKNVCEFVRSFVRSFVRLWTRFLKCFMLYTINCSILRITRPIVASRRTVAFGRCSNILSIVKIKGTVVHNNKINETLSFRVIFVRLTSNLVEC